MKKGERYYIRGIHEEQGGSDNFGVGVEIKQTAIKNHHHSMKELQHFYVGPGNQKFEKIRLTILDISKSVDYRLYFTNPTTNAKWLSENINAKASAEQFRRAIERYYLDKYRKWGANTVDLKMYDEDDKET